MIEDVVSHLAEPTEPGRAATRSCGRQGSPWHVLWTRSHCERLVGDQLAAKGFEVFLPSVSAWSALGGVRRRSGGPLFPGYLFLHCAVDKESFLEVRKARGLVRILGERWDRLGVVPEAEIEAIRRVLEAGAPVLPYAFLREGQRMRITRGALKDLEGILVRARPTKGLLVLSVELLRRSVAVEVDCTSVEAVASPLPPSRREGAPLRALLQLRT